MIKIHVGLIAYDQVESLNLLLDYYINEPIIKFSSYVNQPIFN